MSRLLSSKQSYPKKVKVKGESTVGWISNERSWFRITFPPIVDKNRNTIPG